MRIFRRKRTGRDLDEEIRFHLEAEARQRMEAGESPAEAWAAARRDLGSPALVAETAREAGGSMWADRLLQDARYAFRALKRNPVFALGVSSILALGIGATTAVFGLLREMIFKPLPVERPAELVWFRDPSFSYPIFEQVRDRAGVFSGLFAWNLDRIHVAWSGEPQPAQVLLASEAFYSTLGIRPAAGRFSGSDGGSFEGPIAVISYRCWRDRFGLDPGAVGRALRVGQALVTIAGVTPPEFFGVAPGRAPEVTVPLTAYPLLSPRSAGEFRAPQRAWLHLMGRLRPGLSLEQADRAVQTFWPQVMEAAASPEMPAARRAVYLARRSGLMPGANGYSSVRNRFAEPLWLLFGLVGLLLLVACGTAANLLLSRATARRREIAVRLALGASRGRIARQVLLEGLSIALAGAMLGTLLASWAGALLVNLLSTSREPIALGAHFDGAMAAFSAGLAILTAAAFTLGPAMRAAGLDPGPALKESGRAVAAGRSAAGRYLVLSQVALSMMLLAGAALFGRSLLHLVSLDPGFARGGVLLASPEALLAGYQGERLIELDKQILERARAVAGVRSAALSWVPPVSNEMGSWTQYVEVDGRAAAGGPGEPVYFNAVSPGYFETMGTAFAGGRDFGPQDNETGPRTVIVNQALARAFFPGVNPVGRRIGIGRSAARRDLEIVGVVRDSKYQRLQEPLRKIAYLPWLQAPEIGAGSNLVLEVRVAGPLSAVADALRHEIRSVDSRIPLRFETLEERVEESLVKERALAAMASVLGLMALVLAAAGLYGLVAYSVARRINEIGIRIALGARPGAVEWMVLRECLALAAAGVAGGLGGALALGRLVRGMLYGLEPSDPAALATAAALLLAMALAAGYLPARRAARIDPVIALHSE